MNCPHCNRPMPSQFKYNHHVLNCARLPDVRFLLDLSDKYSARSLAARYAVSGDWLRDHLTYLRNRAHGPQCKRCGVGSNFGGCLDERVHCGWCCDDERIGAQRRQGRAVNLVTLRRLISATNILQDSAEFPLAQR